MTRKGSKKQRGQPRRLPGEGRKHFSELLGAGGRGDCSTRACSECWWELMTVRNDTEYEREHLSPYPFSAISCRQLFVVRAFILVARGQGQQ